jgi:hypothetical protein
MEGMDVIDPFVLCRAIFSCPMLPTSAKLTGSTPQLAPFSRATPHQLYRFIRAIGELTVETVRSTFPIVSTDAKTNLYLSYGRLSIDAEYIGLGSRTYKKHCAPVLIIILRHKLSFEFLRIHSHTAEGSLGVIASNNDCILNLSRGCSEANFVGLSYACGIIAHEMGTEQNLPIERLEDLRSRKPREMHLPENERLISGQGSYESVTAVNIGRAILDGVAGLAIASNHGVVDIGGYVHEGVSENNGHLSNHGRGPRS